jgi:O-antigen ligase
VALPVALVSVLASGLIYHRVSVSLQGSRFGPDSGRLELLIGGVRMIKDHPLFGVGPERIHTEFVRYYRGRDLNQVNFYYGHLENNVIQIAAERGLLCLAAFFWFIFELYGSLLEMLKTGPEEMHWLVLSAIAALSGFIVAGFFSYNFGDSEILLLLLFIVSIPYGIGGKINEGWTGGAWSTKSTAPAPGRKDEIACPSPLTSASAKASAIQFAGA